MSAAKRSNTADSTRIAQELVGISRRLSRATVRLRFSDPVAYSYAPLEYARDLHEQYLALARAPIHALFIGMNPGPFGMVQTGVPFGEIGAVRTYLGIDGTVKAPRSTHPKRPVEGLACARSEVSGRRFWGLMSEEFPRAEDFFRRAFVWNWCPLAFLSASGANLTPDKFPRVEREALEIHCDRAIREIHRVLAPEVVIGVGAFASACASRALEDCSVRFDTVLHPSPASPAANRGWAKAARVALRRAGLF